MHLKMNEFLTETDKKAQDASEITLQKLEALVWSQADCERTNNYGSFQIDRRMLCWGDLDHGVCMGDSGGPLVQYDEQSGRWLQYGVASVVIGNGDTNEICLHSIFVRLAEMTDWIWDTMAKV